MKQKIALTLCFLILHGLTLAEKVVDIGVIKPRAYTVYNIAIPAFEGQAGSLSLGEFRFYPLIYKDLELTGYFRRPQNQNFVEQNHQQDKRQNRVDFGEWGRLPANFLLKGEFMLRSDNLEAEVFLWDVASGKVIFGRRLKGFKPEDKTLLAHYIADLVYRYIMQAPGIAATRIVFVSDRTGKREIWVMDADGGNQRQLTQLRGHCTTPCWGANGTEIYFTSYHRFNPDLYGVSVSGGAPWPISQFPGFNLSPHWSTQQRRIVLTLSKDRNSELYTMTREGKDLQRLTRHSAIDSAPSWSPDGKSVLFTSDRDGMPQLYRVEVGSKKVRRLTWQGSYNDGGVFSPHGDKIAFAGTIQGKFNLVVTDADGTKWVQLTSNQGNNEEPSWSPDGEQLVFTSDRTGRSQLHRINVLTGKQTQLTFQGSNYSPTWSPFIFEGE